MAPLVTGTQTENSDVLFAVSVAVAVMKLPSVTANGSCTLITALPDASVSMNASASAPPAPSPLPLASQACETKTWTRKLESGVLSSVPEIVVTPLAAAADVSTG